MTYEQVISHYGTVIEASKRLGITHQAIYAWRAKGCIPPRAQRHIQAETRGKLKMSKAVA